MLNLLLFLFIFLQSINSFIAFAQDDKWNNNTVNLKGKKVLLFTNTTGGFVHKSIPFSIKAIQKLGKEHGFQVDTTTNIELFNDENLKNYNALIFSSASSRAFDHERQKVALMRYVQSGGGVLGIHLATGEKEWKWYKQMIGGSFVMHPEFQEFNVHVVDPKHPSVKSLPKVWPVKDECYFFKDMNPTIRILLVSDTKKMRETSDLPDTFGDMVPTAWCNDFDGGKQWYTALGHSNESYSDPLFLQHVLGGLKWVAAEELNYSKAYAVSSQ